MNIKLEKTEADALRAKYESAKATLWNKGAGKHNGAERDYGKAYDNLANAGMAMRLKAKYRGS